MKKNFTRNVFSAIGKLYSRLERPTLNLGLMALFLFGGQNFINAQTIQIGSGAETNNYIPFYYLYEKGYSQTIYTVDELTDAGADPSQGLITTIRYKATTSQSTSNWQDWTIFMGNTTQESFSGTGDYISSASLDQVFDGQIAANVVAGEWLEIVLDVPFQWDGTSNLVVTVNQTTEDWGSNPNWASYTLSPTSGNKGIYFYRDGIDYDPTAPDGGTNGAVNKVAQIQLDGDLMSACAGTPDAGTIPSTLGICGGQPLTLTSTGATSGVSGLTYQWESNDGSGWTEIAGATTNPYTLASAPTVPTDYRFVVTCGTNEATSNEMATTINDPSTCYCVPSATNTARYVDNFETTNGIQNISNTGTGFSTGGYGDYTTMVVEQLQGADVDFSAAFSSGTYGFKVWIDWNQNGEFDSDEIAYESSAYGSSHSGTITVPLTALPGATRMRIGNSYTPSTGPAGPCLTDYTSGEFEDYTFEVVELDGCTGMPDAGTIASTVEICSGQPFTLEATGATSGFSGLTYQWESNDGSGWTEIAGANSTTYTVASGPSVPTDYRFVVTCGSNEAISNEMTGTINDPSDCYCIPEATNASRYIDDFITTNGVQNISNTGTGFSTDGYGDFTAMIAGQFQDEDIDFEVNLATGNTYGFKVWIDWNQNGIFESDEVAYQSSSYLTSHTGTITVPATALTGATRMRIGNSYTPSSGPADPCVTGYSSGEFEDYTFVVESIDMPTITQSSATPNCEDGTELTLTGTLEGTQTWYWQETAEGTSLDNDANPYTIFANGEYFARTYDPETGAWSDAASITVSNIPTAPTPPTPVADQNPACTPGTQINVEPATGDVTYYWQGTSSTSTSTADNAENPYDVTETGTYYVRAYDSSTSCWSDAEGLEVVVGTELPNDPIADPTAFYFCDDVTSAEISAITTMGGEESLATLDQNGGNGCGGGAMFDVTNNTAFDIDITAFDMLFNGAGTEVNVYYKTGTYLGSETNQGAWELLGTYPTTGGNQVMENVEVDDLLVPANETVGIYLNYNASYTNITTGQEVSDDNITITVGTGLCSPFDGLNIGRGYNGTVYYTNAVPTDAVWFDAMTGGNVVGTGNPLETVGTSVLPTVEPGVYEFYVASMLGGCESENRAQVTVNISATNVDIVAVDANCNNGDNGTFFVDNVVCGEAPFTFSVDGGAFGPIPDDLAVGTYTVVVKDANESESGEYTVVIGGAAGPSDGTVESVSNDEIVISWTANGDETEWYIEWGEPGFTPGTGTETGSAVATTNPYTITGLDGETEYDIYIAANCGGSTTPGDWEGIEGVGTMCDPVPALGYCEDFNDIDLLGCWRVIDANADGETWAIYTDEGRNGGDAAGIYTDFKGGNVDDYIILPKMILTGNEVMTFWHRGMNNTEPNNYEVVISTGGLGAGDFVDVVHQDTVFTNTYEEVSVDLSAYTGEVFIAFHVPMGSLDGYYLFIDDVCIDICTPIAGVDGSIDVCRNDDTLDLDDVITSEYDHGVWYFNANQGAVDGSILDLTGLASGTYEMMYVVSTACDADTTYATVNVFGSSSAGMDGTITVCKNQPIDLYSALSGSVDMGGDWYDFDGNLLDNSHPTAPNLPANYNYNYVVSNGVCAADTALVEVIVDGSCDWLSIVEEAFGDITVYPNPATDQVNIVNPSNVLSLNIELMDLNGRIVIEDAKMLNNASTATLDVSQLAKGVYTLRVYNEGGQKTFKIVKQ